MLPVCVRRASSRRITLTARRRLERLAVNSERAYVNAGAAWRFIAHKAATPGDGNRLVPHDTAF